ncbi:MAG: nucleotide sugar dehydrogenase [Acidobacteriaceae bacterium]|nr:nucleotide sugar dehydrogenase [Acidobacteriaceae bacterium]
MNLVVEFCQRVERRESVLGIVGLGYVGLPLALEFIESGFKVVGFDVDVAKVTALSEGRSYIHRIEAAEIVQARARGFRATAEIAELRECDAILICVPTPLKGNHEPDMSYVQATLDALAPHLRADQLVVLESTTWPGTTAEVVVPTIERLGSVKVLREGVEDRGVMVAFSPEREDPGNTTTPRREIPKVMGGFDTRATDAAAALYNAVFTRVVKMSSPAAAEMTKLLENIYRSVNIALVNELKQLCLTMGLDVWEIIDAAATKPFGFQAFYPGPGIGGHCIPVDPFYLTWRAEQFGKKTRFIELAGEVNEAMPAFVVETTREALAKRGVDLKTAKVLVLGVAYKRDLDDLRESPALTVIQLLEQAGAEVAYNDPFFAEVGHGRKYDLERLSTPLARVGEFDAVVLTTDHSAYDYPALVEASRLFVDTRGATRRLNSEKIVRC